MSDTKYEKMTGTKVKRQAHYTKNVIPGGFKNVDYEMVVIILFKAFLRKLMLAFSNFLRTFANDQKNCI